MTSSGPQYVTRVLKATLGHKDRLMRVGWIDDAGATAARYNITQWSRNGEIKKNAKDVWTKSYQLQSKAITVRPTDSQLNLSIITRPMYGFKLIYIYNARRPSLNLQQSNQPAL